MMTDENNLIGKQIGNYRVVAEINSGAFGRVYQAQHIILRERIVAIKLLHAYLGSPKEREQFLQEAQFLEKLKHPYCLPIIDAGIHNGLPYVVSEYAMNGSLRNRLRRQSPHPPAHTEQAILKALAKQRADRYPTIADFITALRATTMEQAKVLRAPEEEIPTVLSTQVPTLAQTYPLGVSQRSKGQWMQEGNTLRDLKRYQEALSAYEQAIRLDPNDAYAYRCKGDALYDLKHYQEALAAYEQAISLNPNFAQAYNNKGTALYDFKRDQKEHETYAQAIRLNPN